MKPFEMQVGHFYVESGKLIVSDPCYGRGTWCMGEVDNVLNGKWSAKVGILDGKTTGWGQRNAILEARHENMKSFPTWIKCDFEVGVDSGQAGIFDDAFYPKSKEEQGEYGEPGFYNDCCEATLETQLSADVVGMPMFEGKRNRYAFGKGVVSSSGYGDGGYSAFIAKNDEGQVVGVRIEFITENDLTDDEED